jgi:hypothetical protein
MLYYRANDYPGPLPAKLVAPDGTIFLPGIDGYDPNEILLAGYIPAPPAPVVQNYEILDWDSVNAVWVVTDPRTVESWKEYRIQEVSKYRRDKKKPLSTVEHQLT